MSQTFFLLFALLLGFLLRQLKWVDTLHISILNKLIIFFFIPLLTMLSIPELELNYDLIWLSISPFLVFVFSFCFFESLQNIFKLKKTEKQALILTSGISSTSFVGFPLFELWFGDIGLKYGILMSVGGTVLVFNTIGVGLLFKYTNSRLSFISLLKKILRFIPFVVFIIALAMNLTNIHLSGKVQDILGIICSPFSFLALLTIGMQIDTKSFYKIKRTLFYGQFYKLIIAPIFIYLIGSLFFQKSDQVFQISVLGAAIGSMNALSILTAEKRLEPDLAVAMPAIGIPISIFTLFVFKFIIS